MRYYDVYLKGAILGVTKWRIYWILILINALNIASDEMKDYDKGSTEEKNMVIKFEYKGHKPTFWVYGDLASLLFMIESPDIR